MGGCCSGVPNSDMVQFVSVKLLFVENGWMDQELKQGVYQRVVANVFELLEKERAASFERD